MTNSGVLVSKRTVSGDDIEMNESGIDGGQPGGGGSGSRRNSFNPPDRRRRKMG